MTHICNLKYRNNHPLGSKNISTKIPTCFYAFIRRGDMLFGHSDKSKHHPGSWECQWKFTSFQHFFFINLYEESVTLLPYLLFKFDAYLLCIECCSKIIMMPSIRLQIRVCTHSCSVVKSSINIVGGNFVLTCSW